LRPGTVVKFKEREQYRERIFGKKATKGDKRKRKEASDQVDQGLIEFLIASYMASGESKRELADREEAITGINPLSHPDRQLETEAVLLPDGHEDVIAHSLTSGVIAHSHNKEATTLTTHATHATSLLPARQHAAH